MVPRDWRYAKKGFAEALDLARAGNEHAIYRLRRTIKNNPDTPDSRAAEAVLTEMGVSISMG